MMKLKHQVAISFASEQTDIVEQLEKLLRKKGVKCYYYKHENQYGENLNNILRHYYYTHVKHALIICSGDYLNNHYCQKELDFLRKAKGKYRLRSLFIVKTDLAKLPEMNDGTIYEEWQDNPKIIAGKIAETVNKSSFGSKRLVKIFLVIFAVAIFGLAGIMYFLYA